MDSLGIGHLCSGNDGRNVQVTERRSSRADTDRLVGQLNVLGIAVSLGVHDHGLDAQLAASTLHAQRNLAPVGNKDFFKHGRTLSR